METKICLKCNKEFSKSISCSKKQWDKRLYCSKSCANSVNASRDRLKKYIQDNGAWNKGLKGKSGKENPRYSRVDKNCKFCGNNFTVKNYRKDTALYCSRKCKTDDNLGLSSQLERLRRSKDYKIWRDLVYERDNWTCQKCLVRGGKINAHHIQNFSSNEDLRMDIDNGITLCRECHYKFHKIYGFNNNNAFQLKEFLAVGEEE